MAHCRPDPARPARQVSGVLPPQNSFLKFGWVWRPLPCGSGWAVVNRTRTRCVRPQGPPSLGTLTVTGNG
jgi:hypothetical protein